MDAVPIWIVSIILGVIGALVWLLWNGSDRRLNSHSTKLDNHETRITKLETKQEIIDTEVGKVRDRYHSIVDNVTHSLASWYNEIIRAVRGDK